MQHLRLLLRHIYVFSICVGKKNIEVIEFLGILKKYVSKNKIFFIQERKAIFLLIKKLFFVFHTIFKLDFITQIIYCIINRRLCSHFILFFVILYQSLRNNVNLSLFIQPAKVNNNKMNEKRSQEYQSMDPEYVTGQINSRILELLLRRFCCLIFAPSQKS